MAANILTRANLQKQQRYPKHGYIVNAILAAGFNEELVVKMGTQIGGCLSSRLAACRPNCRAADRRRLGSGRRCCARLFWLHFVSNGAHSHYEFVLLILFPQLATFAAFRICINSLNKFLCY